MGSKKAIASHEPPKPVQILRPREVCERYKISKDTLYRWARTGAGDGFPRQVKFGERVSGWYLHELENWERERAAMRA